MKRHMRNESLLLHRGMDLRQNVQIISRMFCMEKRQPSQEITTLKMVQTVKFLTEMERRPIFKINITPLPVVL